MADSQPGWWSRAFGALSTLAFALLLGAAAYDAVVVAPLWLASPPASVRAWAALPTRPESSSILHPLLVALVFTSTMAWISSLLQRGSRRWWLTASTASAMAAAAITMLGVAPCERDLFGAGGLGGTGDAALVALAGDWIRAAAARGAALLVGAWCALRAHASPLPVTVTYAARSGPARAGQRPARAGSPSASRGGSRAARDFAFGDEDDDDSFAQEGPAPRDRWRGSLGGRRRTAKK